VSETDRVSVVICAYTEDRWQNLVEAIESVQRQTVPPHEIVLVIDHNPSLLARARQTFPGIAIVENRQPRGVSGARNSGVDAANGEVIAFMDEDATAAPDWLGWLSRYYDDARVMGVGGAIEPVWLIDRPKWFPDEFDWVVGCTYLGMPEVTCRVRNLIGCNMSLRREVFQKIGGFRSGIGRVGVSPVGCEETELCIRLNQQHPQSQLLYEPGSRVYHRVPVSRSNWRYFLSRCYAEGLSKAIVARFVGVGDGLSSERAYTFQTLPRGILRGITDVIRHRDFSGPMRSAAIVMGLTVTSFGYVYGLVSLRWAKGRAARRPISSIPLADVSGQNDPRRHS
jgi:glucosyl-dolichyl phosphate glucuronosyltransferase